MLSLYLYQKVGVEEMKKMIQQFSPNILHEVRYCMMLLCSFSVLFLDER